MKKNIFGIIIIISALCCTESVSAQLVGGKGMRLGRSGDCTGLGVCGIDIVVFGQHLTHNPEVFQRGGGEAIDVNTSIDENKNIFVFTFSVSELQKKDPEKYREIEKGKFYIDEDIKLNGDVHKAYKLKRTTPVIMKKGVYDVKIKGDVVTIEIDIK